MQFNDIWHNMSNRILQEFSIFVMTKGLKFFSVYGIINDIEQLCHKPGGLSFPKIGAKAKEIFSLIFVTARCEQMLMSNWILYEPIRSDVAFAQI